MVKASSIDEYISGFPETTQKLLEQVRAVIRAAAPQAVETISYGMPAFKQKKVLVYFAGHTSHIGFYPTGSGIRAFEKELTGYKWSKGAVQFPMNKPIPLDLITRMVQYRVVEVSLL